MEVQADAVPIDVQDVAEFDYDADRLLWQGITPASQGPLLNQDTKTFQNLKEYVLASFPTAANLEKIIKFYKRCFGIPMNEEDNPVTLRAFLHLTKCFGPFVPTENSCIHLEQVNKLVSYTIRQSNTKVSPFAGGITQEKAEEYLRNTEPQTYLIRFSEQYAHQGGFSLAVKADAHHVRHYRILGEPSNAVEGQRSNASYNAKLKLFHEQDQGLNEEETPYRDIEDFMKRRLDEEIEDDIYCTHVCPDMPYNALFRGYD